MKENLYNYNMEIYCENNQEKKKLLNRYSRFQLIEHEFKDTVKRYTIIDKTDLKNIKYSSIYFYRYFINEVKKLFSPLELEYENNVITIINKKELLKKLIDETYNFFIKYPNKIEEMNSILNDMKKGLEYENFEQEIDEESIYPYIFKINLFLDKEEKILKSKSPEIISEYNVPTIINYLIKGIHRNKIKIFFDEKLDEEEVSFEEIKFELKKELNISESEFFDFNFTIKGYYIYNVSTDTVEKIEVDKEIKFYNITTVTKRILELEGFDKNLEEVINFKIQAEDIVGIRNFGDIAGHSAIIDFVEQFENEDLKNSLINKVIDSKLDGWYIKNKNYIHNLFFIDSCYFEILTKFDISKNISMINSNEKNKEEIYVPLENKIMKSDNQLNIEKKYILEFKNLEVNEILKSELTLKYKKELVFMGITKKIINNNFFEEAINYELYFRLNNKYKIIFEYKNLQNPQYLILKENRIGTGKNVFLWSSINSEFFIKSYWEEIFYEKFQDFEKDKISHVYISDDYSIEFVIDKDDIPYIKIIDLEENIEVSQNEIFRR